MDCSLPGSSIHGILQARILECIAIFFSRGSSRPRDWTFVSCISCLGRQILYHWTTWETLPSVKSILILSFIVLIFAWNISNFLEVISSLFHSIVFIYFIEFVIGKDFLSLLAILWNSAFKWVYLSFSPLPLASLLFSAICKASSDNWRRKWKPTPVFLPGESQGQRSLVGCHLWGL